MSNENWHLKQMTKKHSLHHKLLCYYININLHFKICVGELGG